MAIYPPAQDIFDRTLLTSKQKRARYLEHQHCKNYTFLSELALKELSSRLLDLTRDFPNALQISGNKKLQNHKEFKISTLWTMGRGHADIRGDEELIPFRHESLDLILSPLSLHCVNDLPGSLIQMRRVLKPDGLFLGAMFGGETLYELRDALAIAEQEICGGLSPRIFPFADKQQMGSLMQRAGFALPVVDSDIIRVSYDNIYDLCHDLRGMGESNIVSARRKNFSPRSLFEKAEEIYKARYTGPDGRIEASFEIIYLTGWAPHESQQQPLRPGSAAEKLADHLKTQEIGVGEKVH